MPLKQSELLQILNQKQSEFSEFYSRASATHEDYRRALRKVSAQSDTALTELLSDYAHPGARPLETLGNHPNWIVPRNLKWQNREQSLQWVRDRLMGITTFAVDGSQIFPSKDVAPPIALVQVGWYENPHLPIGNSDSYDKDVRLTVMTPSELEVQRNGRSLERQVGMRRFEMEVERLIEFMEDHKGRSDCLVFLDGSLVATFAEAFDFECRAFYAQQCVNLLRASEQNRVPLIGYIDTSHSSDLIQMLQCLEGTPETTTLHDPQLIGAGMAWGDRTPLFCCDRPGDAWGQGILAEYEEQSTNVAFTYLKTNDNPPARLELPRWIYEAGLLDTVMDYVRGELIIGGGYPYVIETADQVAVLQAEDRQLFFRLLQDWAEKSDIPLRFSRKMVSKLMRRR
ncbi:MAG: DNA double-strand break repair nuclease NurA [Thermosynechococcaceae cyanobacterium MS004]|nr:DNA double-strand break repair nuclease NurA [Thermosynechococcaceae cyanobacterium MS004]